MEIKDILEGKDVRNSLSEVRSKICSNYASYIQDEMDSLKDAIDRSNNKTTIFPGSTPADQRKDDSKKAIQNAVVKLLARV